MSAPRAAALALAALAAAALACSQTGPLAGLQPDPPVVQTQTFSAVQDSLRTVVVLPFYPRPELQQRIEGDVSPDEAAGLVANYVYSSLAGQGIKAIAPAEAAAALTAIGRVTPRRDPVLASELAAAEFGASAVLLGEVYRWRERGGEAMGSERPASVGFMASLYVTEGGRRVWQGRFDHTQRTITGNVFTAARYPGGGTRWLTVRELARWGAGHAVNDLVEGQWRLSN